MANLKVELSRKYKAHQKEFDVVEFRQPKLSEYLEIGDVEEWQPNGKNGSMLVEYTAAIGEYITMLCIAPGSECLEDLDLCDQIKIKDSVRGFFMEARMQNVPQTSLDTTSENQ